MITLVFLICTNNTCFSAAQQELYQNVEECQLAAETSISVNQLRVRRGEVQPHSVIYQCVSWGEPA